MFFFRLCYYQSFLTVFFNIILYSYENKQVIYFLTLTVLLIFLATRFNLETEWKNTFSKVRELDREELFEKARGEILDELINLSNISPRQWEDAFTRSLWEKMTTHVFENIYLLAAQSENSGTFNTMVDIKLKHWADQQLPKKCVEVGQQTLKEQFSTMLKRGESDNIFEKLKAAVRDASMEKHEWDSKAEQSLRVIQRNILEDRSVSDKNQWDRAIKFMETSVNEQLELVENTLKRMKGPGTREQWYYWRSKTAEQQNRCIALKELEKLITSQQVAILLNHSTFFFIKFLTFFFQLLETCTSSILRRIDNSSKKS